MGQAVDEPMADRTEDAEDEHDERLVARALAGDGDAYGDLVRRHQAPALRLAATICGSTEEARDIVQDAFVKGHRRLGQFRGEAPVRSWLLRLVANEAKNSRRAEGRRFMRERRFERLRVVASAPADVEDTVAAGDEAARLLRTLRCLAFADREMLGCRFVAGLSEQETAATLGVPIGTVKSRTARALGRARALLEPTATTPTTEVAP